MREGQTIYTYFDLAADKPLTKALLEKESAAVAYETIQTDDGQLPLLKPMSEVAGRKAVQVGAGPPAKGNGGEGNLPPGGAGVRAGGGGRRGGGGGGAAVTPAWSQASAATRVPAREA